VKQNQLETVQGECAQHKDETHRLKNTIVNKDSQNQVLQQFVDKEKDLREAETTELRKLLKLEQERAIAAIREAEQNTTKIEMFKMQAERAERAVERKEDRCTELMD